MIYLQHSGDLALDNAGDLIDLMRGLRNQADYNMANAAVETLAMARDVAESAREAIEILDQFAADAARMRSAADAISEQDCPVKVDVARCNSLLFPRLRLISIVFDLNAKVTLSHFPLAATRRGWLMLNDRYVFSQLIDSLPKHEFDRCVARYHGNRRIRHFSCFDQFLCMAFAQLTYRESLRDIEICLHALHKKLYHAGFRGVIARSTLADANEHRDWRIYADFAQVLIARARRLYQADGFGA